MTKQNTGIISSIFFSALFLCYWGIQAAAPSPVSSYREVRVEPEDTLWTIAARTVGDQQDIRRYIYDVQKINGIQDPGTLQAGQVIRLPRQ